MLKYVSRRLLKAPLHSALTAMTFALGIAGTTAAFSALERVVLRPLPFARGDELVSLWHTAPGWNVRDLRGSVSLYFTYREERRVFGSVGLWTAGSATVTGGPQPEELQTLVMTHDALTTLGIQPALGRLFSAADDQAGATPTVLVSHAYWLERFGGSPSAIGAHIVVDGKPRELIGILPSGFELITHRPALVLPSQFDRNAVVLGNFAHNLLARLNPQATLEDANADVARMLRLAPEKFPPPPGYTNAIFEQGRIAPSVRRLKKDVIGSLDALLWTVMAAVSVVLLIACANVTTLLLVRFEQRHAEFTMRAALGANRWNLITVIMAETLVLGAAGTAVALPIALWLTHALRGAAPNNLSQFNDIRLNGRVLLFTCVVSLVSCVLVSLVPVYRYASGNRHVGSDSRHSSRDRSTRSLIVLQIALAFVLLIASGLMLRTFVALRSVPPGFVSPQLVQTFRVTIPEAEVPDPKLVLQMQDRLVQRVRMVPGVDAVAITSSLPMEGRRLRYMVFAEDHAYAEKDMPPVRQYKFVSPGLFGTLGYTLIAGRDFTWRDLYDRLPVAIVSENVAKELWGSAAAAIGKRVQDSLKGAWREVVGVVSDSYDDGVQQPAPQIVYWPLLMDAFWDASTYAHRGTAFTLRSQRTNSEAFIREIREAVWAVNRNLPLADVRSLDEIYGDSTALTSFALVVLALAAGTAVLLAVVGLYGLVSYSVAQRSREIAIRIAVGATSAQVVRSFIADGLLLSASGVTLGLVAALMMTRFMSSLLFQVDSSDPVTYVALSLLLLAVAAVGSYLPALAASKVDASVALRDELK